MDQVVHDKSGVAASWCRQIGDAAPLLRLQREYEDLGCGSVRHGPEASDDVNLAIECYCGGGIEPFTRQVCLMAPGSVIESLDGQNRPTVLVAGSSKRVNRI